MNRRYKPIRARVAANELLEMCGHSMEQAIDALKDAHERKQHQARRFVPAHQNQAVERQADDYAFVRRHD